MRYLFIIILSFINSLGLLAQVVANAGNVCLTLVRAGDDFLVIGFRTACKCRAQVVTNRTNIQFVHVATLRRPIVADGDEVF